MDGWPSVVGDARCDVKKAHVLDEKMKVRLDTGSISWFRGFALPCFTVPNCISVLLMCMNCRWMVALLWSMMQAVT